jgi:fermentation-respiration switch protein FrsA (DUF1100 family)
VSSKRALHIGVAVAVVAVFAALAVAPSEEEMLFPAPPAPAEPALADGVQRIWIETGESRVEAFLLSARGGEAPRPLVLYAHGNGELVDSWLDAFEPLRARGVAVLLVEYPGYGRSGGTPSEASVRDAFAAAYDWALAQPDVDRERIIGYGRSLGGGAMGALAKERPLAALILESTFTSVGDVAHDTIGVPAFLVRNAFGTLDVVRGFRGPVLVLHGDADASIPVAHAHRLAEAAPHAELEILRCGHNDCPRPWNRIARFLSERGLL